jgi:hypothetical protein
MKLITILALSLLAACTTGVKQPPVTKVWDRADRNSEATFKIDSNSCQDAAREELKADNSGSTLIDYYANKPNNPEDDLRYEWARCMRYAGWKVVSTRPSKTETNISKESLKSTRK